MSLWTPDEFTQFIKVCKNDILDKTLFATLYFTEMHIGEVLVLTKQDIDLEAKTICINKSFQRLGRKDIITIPNHVCDVLKQYFEHLYEIDDTYRIFPLYKSSVHRRCRSNTKNLRLRK